MKSARNGRRRFPCAAVDRLLAVELFKQGYNCSQSVVAAFADLYGFNRNQALRMSASFGAGIGRMRQTCGAACGMFMLAGLDCGATEGSDAKAKVIIMPLYNS